MSCIFDTVEIDKKQILSQFLKLYIHLKRP